MRKMICALGASLFLFAAPVHAADYPTQPIKLVVPFAPGGSVDTVSRIVGQELTKELGQSIVVENRAGAGGNIGFEAVAAAAPDGYTLLMASSPLAVNVSLYKKLGYDPVKSFAPISLVALQPNVLVVNPELPVKSVAELIAYAKANPGKLNFGSSGLGASQHLAGELFKRRTGVDMVHVAYRGGGPAMTDLVAGRIQLMFETIPSAMPYISSGQLLPLAVTVDKRSAQLPDVPTMAEAGVTDFVARGWLGMAAPAGTPQPIIDKLNAAVVKALAEPAVAKRLTELGLVVQGTSPAEFASFLDSEIASFHTLITEAHITLN
ncbi:Bug family tripartite tricarboxylate transporter substrate binding protein [Ancylobacter mangrovi]|uniref:Bug family tripartite tricarboxylate transporter substrate binding protein n=1 Tax=Ancylobacter mangrovi TaxID=2972472 RepID=UPI002161C4BB|nr:tripartite tricarboxylate transporter substrate binding protein [Ancylobacter mangrovi]MCS0503278.1 tripartite tricarboxylate transporter substrate binding protein [Ancylobacter mangrovi]